jgi:hypothetical protein
MNKPKRECGACDHWVKWKNDNLGRGLCNRFDFATRAQEGKGCPGWRGKTLKKREKSHLIPSTQIGTAAEL